mmetsp:Transcript_13202/g.33836  ORF Transcript_13202/g.33836 Transcript_13202/m.33836 type:complete len:468 (+) Transcript_13202:54-1457(+)
MARAPVQTDSALDWRLLSSLCLFSFLVNCKPSEPFLTDYLLTTKNFTEAELAIEVWPWSTFGAFVLLLPFGFAAEIIGSRPLILVGLLCREATRVLLIFGTSLPEMAVMQSTYAAGRAADAIYFAYVYAVAPPSAYATLTSLVIAAFHAGNVVGATLGQVLVWTLPSWQQDKTPLFVLSLVFVSLALPAFAMLPPPCRKLPPSLASLVIGPKPRDACVELAALWRPRTSRLWLCWFLLAGSGHAVVGNYFQLQLAQTEAADVPFGALEAAIELGLVLGALSAAAGPVARIARSQPAAFLVGTSIARAAALGFSAAGADAGIALLPFTFNVVAFAIYALQQAAGSAALARTVVSSTDRTAVLFSANTLVAYAGAAVLGWVGAIAGWDSANAYYMTAAVLMVVIAIMAPLLSVGTRDEDAESLLTCINVPRPPSSSIGTATGNESGAGAFGEGHTEEWQPEAASVRGAG